MRIAKRTQILVVYLTKNERKALEVASAVYTTSFSSFVRMAILNQIRKDEQTMAIVEGDKELFGE
jgi:hypothetical protein